MGRADYIADRTEHGGRVKEYAAGGLLEPGREADLQERDSPEAGSREIDPLPSWGGAATLSQGGRGQIKERTAPRRATNTAGAWVSEELPSPGSCANSRTRAAGWKGMLTMTKKEYITYIQKYICEIDDINRLNRIFNYVSKEYVKDSEKRERGGRS